MGGERGGNEGQGSMADGKSPRGSDGKGNGFDSYGSFLLLEFFGNKYR